MAAIYKSFATGSESEVEKLFHLSFKDCALKISKMDTLDKSETAAKIQPYLDFLYFETTKFGNPDLPREEQIGPAEFQLIMSKIKRWETLLYWLFEIDILMEETRLDELIRDAENRLAKKNWDKDSTRYRMVHDEFGCKKRVTVNAHEDLATLHAERTARGNHTDEIMRQAALLTGKYFK